MQHPYYQSILLIERLHRQFLELVKAELERRGIHDINNVQSLILYNISNDDLTVGEGVAVRADHALVGAVAHHVEGPSGDPEPSHAVVDATGAEASLGDLPGLAKDILKGQVRGRTVIDVRA